MYEKTFLTDMAAQNFTKYGVDYTGPPVTVSTIFLYKNDFFPAIYKSCLLFIVYDYFMLAREIDAVPRMIINNVLHGRPIIDALIYSTNSAS